MNARPYLAALPGLLTTDEVQSSATFLRRLQTASGQIPWLPGGQCDPWNHVEAAMALAATGHLDAAQRAYSWLATMQRADGSWFNYYQGTNVVSSRIDTNVCAYVATGVWHYCLVTGDVEMTSTWWPMVERAVEFVLRWQRPDGAFAWSIDEQGRVSKDALLTGSSSILHSVTCAIQLAAVLGYSRPQWSRAAERVVHVLRSHPDRFLPKPQYAMDWYYPVLSGAFVGDEARSHLRGGWSTFVMADRGVRCVTPNNWVTAAETAECVLAFDACGERDVAVALFELLRTHRRDDGGYITGWVYPQQASFPHEEVTSYSVAAVLLAADALAHGSDGSAIFRRRFAPTTAIDPANCC